MGEWFPFNGQIDEPCLFNRVLDSNEIAALYVAGSAGMCFTNDPAPAFVQQPQSQTVPAGFNATFTVYATNHAPLAYQWFKDGLPLAGQTATNLLLASVQAASAGG